jgi:alpha-glucosidase (family GH31 glycosyl hydrolase)
MVLRTGLVGRGVGLGVGQRVGLGLAVGVLLVAMRVEAQEPRYSQTPEYQSILTEMRSAAPSPAYIATGVRPQADPKLQVEVKEDEGGLQMSTTAARLAWKVAVGQFVWTSLATNQSWTLTLGKSKDCVAAGEVAKPVRAGNRWTLQSACGGGSVDVEFLGTDVLRVTFSDGMKPGGELGLHVDGGGPYFGLGERFWQAGLAGTSLDVRPQDRYGEPGHKWTYVAIPLVYTPTGLGMYADTAFDTKFEVNEADSSFDMKVAKQPVTLYWFAEASPKAVLTAYTGITGRPTSAPQWVFGPWVTALQGKGAVLDTARRLRVEGIPDSALWIFDEQDEANNLGWPFWFNSYYGDPRELNDELHEQGFRVLTYVHPYLRDTHFPFTTPNPVFSAALAANLMQVDAEGKPAGPNFENVRTGNVDFSNPKAVDLWQTMITNAVQKQGFDGWMEDFGEWVRDGDKLAGGDWTTMSELYPLLYHKVTMQVAKQFNPQIAPFVRSGAPGSQSFSVVLWGADQWPNYSRDYGLPSVVTAGITAGMSGYSTWGPDILSSGSDKELWMRWVEFGALTPVMRDHVWMKPEHSWNLWSDAETTAHWRRYAMLHSSLLPYFETYAEEAHRTGIPILRHLGLEYPDDPRATRAEYEYLLGQDILVAPVVSGGAAMRTFYLPKGEWVNFWGGDRLMGGQDVTVSSPVDTIPIVVRAGSVLPFKPEEETGHMDWNDPHLLDGALVWHAYAAANGVADRTFTLPNGTSARFVQHGANARIEGTSKTPHDYEVILRAMLEPTATRLNGVLVGSVGANVVGKDGTRYWWNPSTFELHVVFHAGDFKLDVEGIRTSLY